MVILGQQAEACLYYTASVHKEVVWFMVSTLRSFEHLCFDRTLSKDDSVFEFFVPWQNEKLFLQLMEYYTKEGVVRSLQQLPNRLLDPLEQL